MIAAFCPCPFPAAAAFDFLQRTAVFQMDLQVPFLARLRCLRRPLRVPQTRRNLKIKKIHSLSMSSVA
jgi:hypothetical protein